LLDGKNIHAGIRTPLESMGDIRNDKRCGFGIVYANDIDRVGVAGVIERIKYRIGKEKVYVSVDIDVLDPAYAPATYTPFSKVVVVTIVVPLRSEDGLRGN
jgi:agmatinase